MRLLQRSHSPPPSPFFTCSALVKANDQKSIDTFALYWMFICFVDFDFLIECATNLKCKQQHGRGRIINMPAGGGGRGVCGTGTGLGLSKQTHSTPLHTLNAQDEANYEHACEQWTVNKGNLYENTKVSHLSLAVAAGELTVPMTGQNKQKEDADTDADTDKGHEHTHRHRQSDTPLRPTVLLLLVPLLMLN